jgi:E1A-binding protein p400
MATYEQAMASQQRRIQRHILRHASYLREIFYLQQNRSMLDFDDWQQIENKERAQFVAQHGLKVDDPRLVSSTLSLKRPGSANGLPDAIKRPAPAQLKPSVARLHKPKPKPTVDPTVERDLLQHEARLVERIRAIQTQGLWSQPRLPKVAEPPRQKLHFDYMLEEMAWMAEDFRQEKRWKLAVARHLAYACKHSYDQRAAVKEAERRTRLATRRHRAQAVAKKVTQYWRATLQIAEQQGALSGGEVGSTAVSPTSNGAMKHADASNSSQAFSSTASVAASNPAVVPGTTEPEPPNSGSSPPMDVTPDANPTLPDPAATVSASPEPADDVADDDEDDDYEPGESDVSDDDLSSDSDVGLDELQAAWGKPLDQVLRQQTEYLNDVQERLLEPMSEDEGEEKSRGRRRKKKTSDDKDDGDDNDELKGFLQTLAEDIGDSRGPQSLEKLEACQKQLAKFKDTAVDGLDTNVLLKARLQAQHVTGMQWWLKLYQEQCNGILLHDAPCGKAGVVSCMQNVHGCFTCAIC